MAIGPEKILDGRELPTEAELGQASELEKKIDTFLTLNWYREDGAVTFWLPMKTSHGVIIEVLNRYRPTGWSILAVTADHGQVALIFSKAIQEELAVKLEEDKNESIN